MSGDTVFFTCSISHAAAAAKDDVWAIYKGSTTEYVLKFLIGIALGVGVMWSCQRRNNMCGDATDDDGSEQMKEDEY
jgi:hypothetical protein